MNGTDGFCRAFCDDSPFAYTYGFCVAFVFLSLGFSLCQFLFLLQMGVSCNLRRPKLARASISWLMVHHPAGAYFIINISL